MIIKIIWLLENARKCSNTARNICCLARKLLEIFAAQLGLAQILFENELLENARLGFQIPCSKSPNTYLIIHNLYTNNLDNELNGTLGFLVFKDYILSNDAFRIAIFCIYTALFIVRKILYLLAVYELFKL